MGRLRDDEVRKLLAHLRRHVPESDRLAEIEDVLRSDEAEELLRDPELLAYFPELTDSVDVGGELWNLRIIPYAHMRIVQRGFTLPMIRSLFVRFVSYCAVSEQPITHGPYTIIGRPARRKKAITVRLDVDLVTDPDKRAHIVTVYVGYGDIEGTTAVTLT